MTYRKWFHVFEKKSFEWLILNSSNLRNGLSEICMWSKRIGLGLGSGVCHQRGGETSSCGKGGEERARADITRQPQRLIHMYRLFAHNRLAHWTGT